MAKETEPKPEVSGSKPANARRCDVCSYVGVSASALKSHKFYHHMSLKVTKVALFGEPGLLVLRS